METRTCPFCAETIKAEAIKCRYCGSRLERSVFARSWYRQREGKMIGGVCAGLANEWGLSVTLVRLAFVVAFLLGLWSLPIYIALWIIMPEAPRQLPVPFEAAQGRETIPPEGRRPYL
ncbi:PspC domain-containing protein [Vulgatibacter sp.]|uniref:PspC domain-containing protein n=1 Tax=Vulgatibacter sp. TaxID=1971226 RepID=UPI00356329A0